MSLLVRCVDTFDVKIETKEYFPGFLIVHDTSGSVEDFLVYWLIS